RRRVGKGTLESIVQGTDLLFGLLSLDGVANCPSKKPAVQLVFEQVVLRTNSHSLNGYLGIVQASQHDDWQAGRLLPNAGACIYALLIGKTEVGERHVELLLVQCCQSLRQMVDPVHIKRRLIGTFQQGQLDQASV